MTKLFSRLRAAHHLLSREIDRERERRYPDQLRLARLKKERLAIKDRIARHVPITWRTVHMARALLARLRRVPA